MTLLRAFVSVASHKNFTHAATALGRTQSSVSMQVKKLEELVSKKLFYRDKKTVQITPDGEALLSYANRLLKINDEAVSRLIDPEAHGLVRIGAPDDYSTCLLPEVLKSFSKVHPNVSIEVFCDNGKELLRELEKGKLDIVLATHQLDAIEGEVIRREPLHWVSARGHTFRDESELPLLLFPQGCVCRDVALKALDQINRSWRVAYTSRSLAVLQNAVSAGSGVAVMEVSVMGEDVDILDGQEGYPKLEDVIISLHRNPDRQAYVIDLVCGFLKQELVRK